MKKKTEKKEEKTEPVKKEDAPKKKKRKTTTRKKKAKEKYFHARGKRKESIARATVSEGKGVIRINGMSVDCVEPAPLRDIVLEPIRLAGDLVSKLDVVVNVHGGGVVGQIQAARTAIAKAILRYTGDEELKKKMMAVDRNMVIEDKRRVEPKKYKGPKARARFQKSYR